MSVYDVRIGQQVVGRVEMLMQGLYYSVSCQCEPAQGIFKLVDRCDRGDIPIGICCPADGCMEIRRLIPVKKLGSGEHDFFLVLHGTEEAAFYPLNSDEPCSVIDSVEKMRFTIRDGVPGCLLTE